MGRKKIEKPQVSDEMLKRVKWMIKEYPQRKYEIYCYEHSNVKMKRFVPVGKPFTKEETLTIQKYQSMKLPTGEKNALLRYFEDRELVFLLESGMNIVPDGVYKDIATDKILAGLSTDDIMKKYGVCERTVKRAVHDVKLYIAAFVEQYRVWKRDKTLIQK